MGPGYVKEVKFFLEVRKGWTTTLGWYVRTVTGPVPRLRPAPEVTTRPPGGEILFLLPPTRTGFGVP